MKFKLALRLSAESETVLELLHMRIDDVCGVDDKIMINESIDAKTRLEFKNLLIEEYIMPERPDESVVKQELKLRLNNDEPFHFTPRRLAYEEKLREILDRLLEKGHIRPSQSEYASPIVLIKKKNAETRMCIDYRVLNEKLARDNYPLPLIEDQLDVLANKKYFSLLDLKDGYYVTSRQTII